jgi:GWxTD domain-containing protein
MLLNRITTQGEKRSILPNITSNVGDLPEPFHVYFEVYNQAKFDSVRFVVTALSEKSERKVEFDTVTSLRPGRNEKIFSVDHTSLTLGDYRLYIRAYPVHQKSPDEENYLAATNRAFLIRWRGLPKSLKDLDVAIEQLRYVAKDNEWSLLKEAKTPEEKQARFLEFWKKRDPNPSTPRNEKMEEFYQRVEYANKHFKHYIEGWRTDMGMIYLIFGPPNNVDRHPFEIDSKPYEVWSYYDLNYSFVFVDQTGFGDYRLMSQDWQYLNWYRN